MKKTVILIGLGIILFCWVAAAKATELQIEKPVWKVGDGWIYSVKVDGIKVGLQTGKVAEVNPGGYLLDVVDYDGTKKRIRYDLDLSVQEVLMPGKKGSLKYSPKNPRFKWPLKPGKHYEFYSWARDIEGMSPGKNDVKVKMMITLEENGDAKIVRELSGRDASSTWQEKDEVIYSSKVKFIVKQRYKAAHISEYELISFTEGE